MVTSPLERTVCVYDRGFIGTYEGRRGPLIRGRYVTGGELCGSGIIKPAGGI